MAHHRKAHHAAKAGKHAAKHPHHKKIAAHHEKAQHHMAKAEHHMKQAHSFAVGAPNKVRKKAANMKAASNIMGGKKDY